MSNVRFDDSGLRQFQKALKEKYKTRVGILGNKASEEHKGGRGMTNAEIGAVHEFGSITRGIPTRSFLRLPLEIKIFKWIKKNSSRIGKLIKNGNLKKWYVALGFEAERIVNSAFVTRGFGKWKPLKRETIKRKGSDMPLIDTGQLRASITSKVIENDK